MRRVQETMEARYQDMIKNLRLAVRLAALFRSIYGSLSATDFAPAFVLQLC